MPTIPMTPSDLEDNASCLKHFLTPMPREIQHILTVLCFHMKWKAQMTFNYNGIRSEGVLKATGSYVQRKSGNIWEMVQDKHALLQNCYQKLTYGLSNCAISDDLQWPLRSFTYSKPFQMQFFIYTVNHKKTWLLIFWSPYVIGQTIIFLPCSFLLSFFFFLFLA